MPHDEATKTTTRSKPILPAQPGEQSTLLKNGMSQRAAHAENTPLEFEDFLTPEQRLNIVADVLSDIALRMARQAVREGRTL
jgi:hypothetical protein